MFFHLKELLPKSIDQRGLTRTFDAAHVCEITRLAVKSVLGLEAMEFVKPIAYKNGAVYLETLNSGWAYKSYMQRHLLIDSIKKKLPDQEIKAVIIKRTALRPKLVDIDN